MEKKKKVDHSDRVITILFGIIVLLFIAVVIMAADRAVDRNTLAESHVVPKDRLAVYYGMDDSSIVIVLDSRDPTMSQMASEIGKYLGSKR